MLHNQYHVLNVVMYKKILNVKNMKLINMFEDVDHNLYEYDILNKQRNSMIDL
jgi:hypothetical protein